MAKLLAAVLISTAGALAAPAAHADAKATVTVNGVTRTLPQTGFIFEQVGSFSVLLAPGQSADYSFSYSIAVSDDGLPGAFDPRATGCMGLHHVGCNPPYTGFEFAKVDLQAFYEDPRSIPPFIRTEGSSSALLETHGDSFAESLTQSGTFNVRLTNLDPSFTYSRTYGTYVGVWAFAVPEPAVTVQLLAGFALVGLVMYGRGRRNGGGRRPAA
jgi:hypothetical protein